MDIVAPAHPGDDAGRDKVDEAALPVDLVCHPGACAEDDQHDQQSPTQGYRCGMRTALIWCIEDLMFPGDATKIANAKVGQGGEQNEYDDESHGVIVNEFRVHT